ncbi:hypothetical protein BS78_07G131900 [Paspalum vaginatum]|nr:hypothetical protein BS78_07G131900 [Paspalum vaginatum]
MAALLPAEGSSALAPRRPPCYSFDRLFLRAQDCGRMEVEDVGLLIITTLIQLMKSYLILNMYSYRAKMSISLCIIPVV